MCDFLHSVFCVNLLTLVVMTNFKLCKLGVKKAEISVYCDIGENWCLQNHINHAANQSDSDVPTALCLRFLLKATMTNKPLL